MIIYHFHSFFQRSCTAFAKEIYIYTSKVIRSADEVFDTITLHPFSHTIIVSRQEDVKFAKLIFGDECNVDVETDSARAAERVAAEEALAYLPHPLATYASVCISHNRTFIHTHTSLIILFYFIIFFRYQVFCCKYCQDIKQKSLSQQQCGSVKMRKNMNIIV